MKKNNLKKLFIIIVIIMMIANICHSYTTMNKLKKIHKTEVTIQDYRTKLK